ncbi:hypothetical protein AOLI_G00127320 [Acnodon oligacanthus]
MLDDEIAHTFTTQGAYVYSNAIGSNSRTFPQSRTPLAGAVTDSHLIGRNSRPVNTAAESSLTELKDGRLTRGDFISDSAETTKAELY